MTTSSPRSWARRGSRAEPRRGAQAGATARSRAPLPSSEIAGEAELDQRVGAVLAEKARRAGEVELGAAAQRHPQAAAHQQVIETEPVPAGLRLGAEPDGEGARRRPRPVGR